MQSNFILFVYTFMYLYFYIHNIYNTIHTWRKLKKNKLNEKFIKMLNSWLRINELCVWGRVFLKGLFLKPSQNVKLRKIKNIRFINVMVHIYLLVLLFAHTFNNSKNNSSFFYFLQLIIASNFKCFGTSIHNF